MADPLTDKIDVEYRRVDAYFDGSLAKDSIFAKSGRRCHRSKEGAQAAAAQAARAAGAPEDARVIIDYDVFQVADRVIVDWHLPVEAGQPGLLRRYESFRLSEIPR